MFQDMPFQGGSEATIGVELEFQILDHETGDLAPGGLRILTACENAGIAGVSGEFLLSTIEVKTGICSGVAEIPADLFPRLRQVRNIAKSLGYDLAMGGTHPVARPSMMAIFPDERYERIREREGWMAYQESVFGLHIHVGVPDGDAAIGVINRLVEHLPCFLALSANSPYWGGVDTDFASARVRMFRPSASSGIPLCFRDWQEFLHYGTVLEQAGVFETVNDLYWDIRPHPKFGTVEFRIFDVPSTLSVVLGLAALTRCLVVDALRTLKQEPESRQADPAVFWLANENKWLASRYGLQAQCALHPGEPRVDLRSATVSLIDRLLPLAEELDEANFLKTIHPGLPFETGAERQRRIYRQSGSWHAVVDDLKNHWIEDLEQTAGTLAADSSHAKSAGYRRRARRAVNGQASPRPRRLAGG